MLHRMERLGRLVWRVSRQAQNHSLFVVTDAVTQAVTYTATDSTDNVTVNQTVTVTFFL